MPIRIVVVRENQYAPVVFCDHCQQKIERASDGNYEYEDPSGDGASDIFFTHKGCALSFQKAHLEMNCSGELDVLPLYLSNNLKIDPEEAKRSAELLAEFDFH